MTDTDALQIKLTTVDPWVLEEFGFLHELLEGLGCPSRPESGPGLAYGTRGRTVVRLHPKRRHLAVGLPEALRADVDALNTVERAQRGSAWLNYGPTTCDRDTVEELVTRAVRSAALPPAPAGASGSGGAVRRQRDDHADLALVLAVLRAYGDHAQRTGGPAGVKVLREAVFFAWEAPRPPPGGKYSPHLPHSSAAREHRTSGAKGGLVFEHVTPISLVIRSLLADVPPDEEALRRTLDAHSDRVVITKAQDRQLSAAGLRSAAPDPADPWSRYRAIGLERSDFAPLRQSPVSLA